MKIDKPVNFFVSTWQDTIEHNETDLSIGGIDLDKVTKAMFITSLGKNIKCEICDQTESSIRVIINRKQLHKSGIFFILLTDDHESWFPVGPIIIK